MASIDSGPGLRRKRSVNHQLPLVPFIDFLICLVVFLLAQAGFANLGRLPGNARVPGHGSELSEAPERRLHLDVREQTFRVSWRSGATVLESHDVPVRPVLEARGMRRFPDLTRFLQSDFLANGVHQRSDDPVLDQAVLHVANSTAYEDVVATLDSLRAPRRAVPGATLASAYAISFASD